MLQAMVAGTVYAVVVYLMGFCMGTIRVLLVAPRVGEVIAVCLEAPVMLAVSWFMALWCFHRLRVPRHAALRILAGVVAFALLMLGEWAVASVVFGRSVEQFLSSYHTVAGLIGLMAQLAFASFPLLQLSGHLSPDRRQALRVGLSTD